MTYFEALLYGLVQGVAEFLPISSSAHLILLPKFLGTQDPGLTFDVFLHLGTLLAILIYFWRDWAVVFSSLPYLGACLPRGIQDLSKKQKKAGATLDWRPIVLATLPALVAGALLHTWVKTIFRGPMVIASTLILGGVVLFIVDYFLPKQRRLKDLTLKDALWVGLAQCVALVPGVSRSGATITGGRLLGFDRSDAARFSFLISGPVTAAAVVFELKDFDQLLNGSVGLGPLTVAFVSSFGFGLLAIGGLLQLLKRFGYFSFALYRVLLAVVVIQTLL